MRTFLILLLLLYAIGQNSILFAGKPVYLTHIQFSSGEMTDTIYLHFSGNSKAVYEPIASYRQNDSKEEHCFSCEDIHITQDVRDLLKKLKDRKMHDFSFNFLCENHRKGTFKVYVTLDPEKVSFGQKTDSALGGRTMSFFFTRKKELAKIKNCAHLFRRVT